MLRIYYFLLRRKKLLGQPNTNGNRCSVSSRVIVSHRPYCRLLRRYPVLEFAYRGNFGFPLRSSDLRDWSAYNRGDRGDYASEYRVKLLGRRRRARHYERAIKRNVRAGNMWPSSGPCITAFYFFGWSRQCRFRRSRSRHSARRSSTIISVYTRLSENE